MQSLKFNNSIDGLSILVGILTIVFTMLVFVAGLSFYTNSKVKKVQSEKLAEMKQELIAKSMNDLEIRFEKNIKEQVLPSIRSKIRNLEVNFWSITNVVRKLETAYWQELKELRDIELAIDRNNKLEIGISYILSQKNVKIGLENLYCLEFKKSFKIFEELLYTFYRYGLFDNDEEDFFELVKNECHTVNLHQWLKRVNKEYLQE